VAAAAAVIYFRVAILLVSLIASEQETGYFGVSSRVVEALVAIPTLMVGAAFPIFARAAMDDHVRLAYGFDRTLRVSVAAGVGVALGLFFGAPIAIDVLGGSGFEPAIEVLRIQGVAVGATFVSAFWSYAMLSLRLHREIMFVSIAALLLVFVLVAVLCSADGARGAAVGTAIAELAIALGYPLVLGRRHPNLVPRAGFLRGVAGAAAVAAAVWFVPVGPLVQTVLGLAVYGVALVGLRALPEEVLVELRRLTGRGRRPAPG
jgi:O-antigen/teichoic acid export membrane protein